MADPVRHGYGVEGDTSAQGTGRGRSGAVTGKEHEKTLNVAKEKMEPQEEARFSKRAWIKDKATKLFGGGKEKKVPIPGKEEKALAVMPSNAQIASLRNEFHAKLIKDQDNSSFLESMAGKLFNLLGGKGKLNVSQLNMVDLMTLKNIAKITQNHGDKVAGSNVIGTIDKAMLESKEQVDQRAIDEMLTLVEEPFSLFQGISAFTELHATYGDLIQQYPNLAKRFQKAQEGLSRELMGQTMTLLRGDAISERVITNAGEENLKDLCHVIGDYLVLCSQVDPSDGYAARLINILTTMNGDSQKKLEKEAPDVAAKLKTVTIDPSQVREIDPTLI